MIRFDPTVEAAGSEIPAAPLVPPRAGGVVPWLGERGLTILLTLAALVPFVLPSLAPALQLDRSHPGQVWRWVTCHFAHCDGKHLFWSLSVFAVLMGWLEPLGRRRLLATLGVASVAIPAGILLFNPELSTYRGLSGLDSALFLALMLAWARKARSTMGAGAVWLPVLAGVGFAAKLAYELVTGTALFADSEAFVPVPLAHAVGGIVGIAMAARAGKSSPPP